jgi:small subunit ribosomal protein S21|tara:strand:+ start:255 stop:461 length:207 start_codon:yes stop_codon:yes gene_type:complete
MVYVKVDKRKSIEKAISIFKRKVKESGILLELRERQEFKKPSAVKRKKRAQAKARMRQRKEKRPTKWL